jgi:hypothetical protein
MTGETYKEHNVFEKLNQLNQALSSDTAKDVIEIENYLFFQSAFEFITDRLKLTIPSLVQEAELKALSSEIEAGTVQINSYIGNKNIGHINNAVNNLTSSLNRVRNLPLLLSKGDFDFSKAVATFQKTFENAYDSLESEKNKLKEQLKLTEDDLITKNTLLSALQQQITAKEVEIKGILTKYTAEFETLKSNSNTSFESEKKKFNDAIDSDRKLFKEQFDEIQAENQKTFEGQTKKVETDSSEVLVELNNKLYEANKIVNIVGNVGVTGNYQNIANDHKKSANNFRFIALGFMIVMSVLLIWSIIELSNGKFNLYKSLVRILAAAVLTYPAIYASTESSKHRKLETQNRKLELELASIGPFIELLSEEKKHSIKEELVKKYFGNHSLPDDSKDEEDISINGLEKILKVILPHIKK